MEFSFPVVRAIWNSTGFTRMICPASIPLVIQDIQKTCPAATSFGITSIISTAGPGYRPVKLRIFVEVRRQEKGILANIMKRVAAIFEHGKAHVHVVVARR